MSHSVLCCLMGDSRCLMLSHGVFWFLVMSHEVNVMVSGSVSWRHIALSCLMVSYDVSWRCLMLPHGTLWCLMMSNRVLL